MGKEHLLPGDPENLHDLDSGSAGQNVSLPPEKSNSPAILSEQKKRAAIRRLKFEQSELYKSLSDLAEEVRRQSQDSESTSVSQTDVEKEIRPLPTIKNAERADVAARNAFKNYIQSQCINDKSALEILDKAFDDARMKKLGLSACYNLVERYLKDSNFIKKTIKNTEEPKQDSTPKPLVSKQLQQQIGKNVSEFADKAFFHVLNARNEEEKICDFRLAFLLLRQKFLDEKICGSGQISETFIQALLDEATNIPVKHLPYLTEAIHRYLFKVNHPNDPVNHIHDKNIPGDPPDGANTRRGLALSDEIAGFKWGKLLGGLLKLVVGGVLVSAAVLALMASFGGAAPLSAALVGLGVYVATPAAITGIVAATSAVATVVGAVASVATLNFLKVGVGSGLYDIGKSVYDKFAPNADNKIISKEMRNHLLFKPEPAPDKGKTPAQEPGLETPGLRRSSEDKSS